MATLVNQKFGMLTVIKKVESKNSKAMWECKCACGNTSVVSTSNLKSGHTKSCGCMRNKSHAENLKGQRFGYLLVKKRFGTKNSRALWKCKCDCGKYTIVRANDLKSGNTQSCGCLGHALAKRNLLNNQERRNPFEY